MPGRALEGADELAADDLAFVLWVGDVGQGGREGVLGGDGHQVDSRGRDEVAFDLLGLVLAQQPVVDEHAGEAGADGALDQGRRHRGVDPAGQAADRVTGPDGGPDRLDLLVDDVRRGPVEACSPPRRGSA